MSAPPYSLETLPPALAGALQAALTPALSPLPIDIADHPGRFDAKLLMRVAVAAPAIRLALVTARGIEFGGENRQAATARWVAYLIAKDRDGIDRQRIARRMAGALTYQIIQPAWWKSLGLKSPERAGIEMINLFDIEIDQVGIALWGVAWSQPLVFSVL
jgi:hypothetical protein